MEAGRLRAVAQHTRRLQFGQLVQAQAQQGGQQIFCVLAKRRRTDRRAGRGSAEADWLRRQAQPRLRLAELAREPLILIGLPHSRDYFLSLFRAAGVTPRIACRALHGSLQPQSVVLAYPADEDQQPALAQAVAQAVCACFSRQASSLETTPS